MAAPAIALMAGKKSASQLSVSITGYDFIGLALRLGFFYLAAFLIDLYFKATIKGGTFLNLIGLNFPQTLPDPLRNLFTVGYQGFTFWNIVQVISILMVVIEYAQYEKTQKQQGLKINATTQAVFLMIALGLSLVTFPQIIQKVQEKRILNGLS